MVLALGYPRKRESIDFTAQQTLALAQLNKETHARLYQIDCVMLARALEVLAPPQREELSAMIEAELGG